jgi:dethiobiotin synthetase
MGQKSVRPLSQPFFVQAFEADFWKPIQLGNTENSDSLIVSRLVSNSTSEIHSEAYLLPESSSPFASAEREGLEISLKGLEPPKTDKLLIIEGVGGALTRSIEISYVAIS